MKRNASLIAALITIAVTITACTNRSAKSAVTLLDHTVVKSEQPPNPEPTEAQLSLTETTATTVPTLHAATPLANEPIKVTGSVKITFPLFENYLVEPYVMLEDESGFVARDFEFIIPPENQVLGPLTRSGEHDWEYVLHLPTVPPGMMVDVDNNGRADNGVRIFALAVQANMTNDPFLGEDEFRGWSSVWTSARIDSENHDEISGGVLIVWAPDAQQAFPIDFGPDGLLFTSDDSTFMLKPGYTIVDINSTPFTFSKKILPKFIRLGVTCVGEWGR